MYFNSSIIEINNFNTLKCFLLKLLKYIIENIFSSSLFAFETYLFESIIINISSLFVYFLFIIMKIKPVLTE